MTKEWNDMPDMPDLIWRETLYVSAYYQICTVTYQGKEYYSITVGDLFASQTVVIETTPGLFLVMQEGDRRRANRNLGPISAEKLGGILLPNKGEV